jgi:hydrogenase/urease accessory protein HupE
VNGRRRLALVALAVLCGTPALAHEVRPAYLELREREPGAFEVLWKTPARGDERLAIAPRLPERCRDGEHAGRIADGAWIERWPTTCSGGLAGGTIAVDALAATRTDVLVRIEWADGTSATARLTPAAAAFAVAGAAGRAEVLATYLALGVEHILLGPDHLLFLLALLFLVSSARGLVATITAFTAAHSLTLSGAALGWLHVPQPPVEAVIALSILFVAAEVARAARGARPDLARRSPWIVAFAFGLLHGLGFAGALREVGLPAHAIPLALFAFNVGVELGQLAFVAAVLALLAGAASMARRSPARRALDAWTIAGALARPASYAMGPLAAFWLIERTARFWH